MKKRMPVIFLVLLMGCVWVAQILAEGTSLPTSISGTITKVDPGKQEIAVRNQDGEMRFQWNGETLVNGSVAGETETVSEKVKEGMAATVIFTEAGRIRIANRIEVRAEGFGDLKGWGAPFTCGTSVC